jgi:hypothetical protein
MAVGSPKARIAGPEKDDSSSHIDFWISWPETSEELFVDLIFNGKSRVRVLSEMFIFKSTEFPGSENIAQMLIYFKDFDAIVNENYNINYPRIS